MANTPSTRQLILEAVVSCIEKYGLEQVTTRKIAVEAGTNIASINYHFRSKDHLVAEAFSMTIEHMLQDVFAAIDDSSTSFEVTLADVLFYLLEGSLRFPGISRAHLNQAVRSPHHNSISARAMSRVFDGLAGRAARAYPRKDRHLLRLRLAQVMSSVMLAILRPDFFSVAQKYQLTSTKHARQLAASYTEMFLDAI